MDSQQSRVPVQLRDMTLQGESVPGERLAAIPLAEKLGASRTPVRRWGLGLVMERLSAIDRAASCLLLGEGALDDEVAGRRGVAFLEAACLEDVLEVDQQARAAAQHHAVLGGVDRRHPGARQRSDVRPSLGTAPAIAFRLAIL